MEKVKGHDLIAVAWIGTEARGIRGTLVIHNLETADIRIHCAIVAEIYLHKYGIRIEKDIYQEVLGITMNMEKVNMAKVVIGIEDQMRNMSLVRGDQLTVIPSAVLMVLMEKNTTKKEI